MKILRIITLSLIAISLLLALPMVVLADMADPDEPPTMMTLKAYRNLLESGDRLFVAYFNLPYASTPPDPVSETYIWQLINTDGSTVLGTTTGYVYVFSGYGYQVVSLYFEASANISWNPTPNYQLKLIGNPIIFETPPDYYFPITSDDYSENTDTSDVQLELATDIVDIAVELDGYWGLEVSLLTQDESGQYLSAFGQGYFRGCIPQIQYMAPGLFAMAVQNLDVTSRDWTDSYVTSLEAQNTGTWIETAQEATKSLFVVDYDILSIIIVAMLCIGVLIANIYITSDHWNGLIDAAFIAIIATRIGLFGLGYLSLIAALCIVFIGIKIWGFARA